MIPYLQVEHISKRWAEVALFEQLSFTLEKDKKVALIAPNGAGKSSLMDILAGYDTPDEGKVTLMKGVRVACLRQNPVLNPSLSVLEQALWSDNPRLALVRDFDAAVALQDTEAIARLSTQMDAQQAWDMELRVKQILSQLHITDLQQKVGQLSGGQQKRVALANVLVNEPDLLLLDEPTNHLDLDMIEWLELYLQRSRCTLFMVTHDRYFLDRVCNEILEIDEGRVYSYDGNYSYYLQKRQERLEQQQAATEKAQNLFRTEQEWMRRMPQARGHKAKYRVEQFYDLQEKAGYRRKDDVARLEVSSSRLGKKIVVLKNISKSYDGLQLIRDFSYTFSRFEKVGMVGKNGIGKSTLLNILVGSLPPDSGEVELGQTLKIGYYRQEGINFQPQDRVIDVVRNIAEVIPMEDGSSLSASALLTRFLFPPDVQYCPVEKLSGGERRRLYLCTVLMQNPNFLILDEPTNDLDIMTLAVLEDYLANFKGCVLIVSHDRFFMDEVVDHLFVFEGNGEISDFPGSYSEYREHALQQERMAAKREAAKEAAKAAAKEAVQPKVGLASEASGKPVGLKLSFKEKKLLETLEASLLEMETEKASLIEALHSGLLSPEALLEKSQGFAALTARIDEAELQWLELDERRAY